MHEKEFYNLTNPQKSIWYTEEMFKGTTINNICTSGIIYGNIDESRLKQAINNVVSQNDSFRIHLTLKDGNVKQYISEFNTIQIATEYIEKEDDLHNIENEEAKHIFNVLNSDLFKFKIVILKDKFACVILTANHIISDSWSMGITIKEILRNYNCLSNKTIPKQETFSYLDYITSEEKYLNSPKYEADKVYWQKEFETIPEQATIPSLNLNSSSHSNLAQRATFDLDKTFVNKINDFCMKNHFSNYAFFLGIYSIYISRVSNTDDFVIGTPILNRTNIKEKHTTGMFINTAPVRINKTNSSAFVDFLNSISQKTISILRHQKYSYNTIIEDLRKENKNLASLYNIMVSYQITKAFNKDLGNYKTNWTFNNYCANDMNIHITDINDTGNLTISYDYLVDKYDEKDIKDLHTRIIYIIEQILSNYNILLDDIEIATEKERDLILNKFNNTYKDYPKNKTIIDLFEEQVQKTPDNIAVVFENKKLTYKELNEKSNSLAYYLRNTLHINRNDLVGIMCNRSLEMIIAILSVLKSGGAYIPIDPTYPEDRIDYMLNSSKSKVILTQRILKEKIAFDNKIYIDLNNSNIYNSNFMNLNHINTPDDLAYVIFTSGSTGKPKGVMIPHRVITNFTNYCNDYVKYLKNPKYDTIVSISTISFDIFFYETIMSLQKGLKVVIANEDEQNNLSLLNNLIEKNNVKIIQSTPSRMQIFVENITNIPNLKNLQYIILAGEQLPLTLVDKIHNLSDITIYNGYGPSETFYCTIVEINNNFITIGTPIYNTQMYILDKYFHPVPIGIVGDIYISGIAVGNGYLNNKELTDKSFIKDPFNKNNIMYKTGDLGKYTENGQIICLGRSDYQIKIRGQRVETEEIESLVLEYTSVKKAIVVKQIINNSEYISCYYTSESDIDVQKLKEFLFKKLPKYMVPSYFTKLDDFPYTPNGKIDRKNLPTPQEMTHKSNTPPRNNIDSNLIELLKSLLHVDDISIDDDFFNIGGDSLSAINLCAHIQNTFNVQLFVRDILEHSQIRSISDMILKNINVYKEQTIKTIPKSEFYPVSSAQKRIYFASQIAGSNSVLYNIPGGVILDETIDFNKLKNCFDIIINRHESLRTYFELQNENVVQKVLDEINFNLDKSDNCNFEDITTLFEDFVKPFDLSKAPLFRAKYLSFSNGKSAIFLDMHHIISDGTSLSIFTDELCKLYSGNKLPELSLTYKDFASYENEAIKSGLFNDAEKFWTNQFKDEIPVLNIPSKYTRPAVQTYEGKRIHSYINETISKEIKQICNDLNITPYMLLLSCYYILLSKYTSQDDIVIGSPIIGRTISQTYGLIGVFINTLALRNKIDENYSFKDFVLNIKEKMLEAYKYQAYPFDELINKLNIKRDSSRNPLFDTMFIYQNNGYGDVNFKNIKTTYYTPDTHISKFDLSLEVLPTDNGFNLNFEYATCLFEDSFIKDLSEHYLNILNNILENISIKISDIDMFSKDESLKILYDFNDTYLDYPKNLTIAKLFEEQVEKSPESIAIVFGNKKITYKELNNKANSLAHFLRNNKNVSRNDLVGIMCNRSIEMIVSILAVLKAGGAYIPIDPTYPLDRIYYMLDMSHSKILLTQKELDSKVEFDKKLFVDLDSDIYNDSTENLELVSSPNDLAYVIFTSGSTGKPKGVMLKQKNIVNFTYGIMKEFNFSNNDSIACITTVSFDIFVLETIVPLLNGLKIILANEEEQTNVKMFNSLCINNKVDIIQATPSRMQTFMLNKNYLDFIKNASYILIGGEPFPSSLLDNLKEISTAKIYNMYGPTETAVWSTLKNLTDTNEITIGKPIINTQVYILDKNLHPLPIGVPGDIYISGDGVSKGYINKPELTKKSFVPNIYIPNTLMYKTGDLGFFTDNGEIICLGRSDSQVKIRGLRIELGEIESLMLKYPYIKKACVIKQVLNNREFISAYFVAEKKITINKLRKRLLSYLPRYMLPSYFIALNDFPYTPNGKIDKKLLPLPKEILSINTEDYIPPKTDLQRQLVEIFEKILNTNPIGINDNFFELGGDSLLAMNLNIELLKISNKIKYADIFRYPTIAELEEKIVSDSNKPLFSKIENLSDIYVDVLKNCTKKAKLRKWHPRNVLLLGSTGFLGIHVLEQLIKHETGNIYCIVREDPGVTSKTKLYQKLYYYFGDKYTHLIDKRIFVLTGTISEVGFGLNQADILNLANSIDVVINCAANVSHYGNYNDFYNTNVRSVKYMIDFCKSFKKKLYHVSTTSVSGMKLDLSYPSYKNNTTINFDESCLYVGQITQNVYVRSKFEAENFMLQAIGEGLDGYILRIGNLMPRAKDGVFQENILDNAFVGEIASFVRIGAIPDYILNEKIEFTPVDCAAKAIVKLITHPTKINRIFHVYNHNTITIERLFKIAKKMNHPLKVMSEKEFTDTIKKILDSDDSEIILNNLLNIFDKDLHLDYKFDIILKSNFTIKYLRKLFFRWPRLSTKYLIKFIDLLRKVI